MTTGGANCRRWHFHLDPSLSGVLRRRFDSPGEIMVRHADMAFLNVAGVSSGGGGSERDRGRLKLQREKRATVERYHG